MFSKKKIVVLSLLPLLLLYQIYTCHGVRAENASFSAAAQQPSVDTTEDARSPYQGLKRLPKRYVEDAYYIFSSPSRVRKEHILPIAIVIGGTAGLMAADKSIRKAARGDLFDSGTADALEDIKFLGNGLWDGAICGGFYIGGLMFRNEKWKEIAVAGGESLLFAGGISQAVKNLTGRYRPDKEKGPFRWRGPTTESSLSFPSGHTTMSFALASVIATVYDDNFFVGLASYGVASVVAFERVYSDSHWTSDVFLGAAIGTVIGRSLVLNNRKKKESFVLRPIVNPNNGFIGVALNRRF